MSALNLIVFVAILLIIYLANIISDWIIKKKFSFKIGILGCAVAFFLAAFFTNITDDFVSIYVEMKVPHKWEERVIWTQEVTDISRSREQEGSFLLGFGRMNERETFRYTIVHSDGTSRREKLYTSDCSILKAQDKKQKIVYLTKIRIYENPEDKKFFRNDKDVTEGYYRVYLL